jgi:hypothetical protein
MDPQQQKPLEKIADKPAVTPPVNPVQKPIGGIPEGMSAEIGAALAQMKTPGSVDANHPKIAQPEKSLRTLETDIRDAVERRNASAASIAIAEQVRVPQMEDPAGGAKPDGNNESSGLGKKFFIILVSLVMIGIGLGGAYLLYLKSPLAPQPVAPAKPATIAGIVTPDSQATLDLSGASQSTAEAKVKAALTNIKGPSGSIYQIVPIGATSATGTKSIMTAEDFIALTGLQMPDALARSISGPWMLGTYNDNGVAAPFVVFSDDFFQNAYAGMIDWEKTMPNSLSNIFSYSGTQGSFLDGVIQNKDVRLFMTPGGNVLFLYSFVDNNTIVITSDGNALTEIIHRLENQSFIR